MVQSHQMLVCFAHFTKGQHTCSVIDSFHGRMRGAGDRRENFPHHPKKCHTMYIHISFVRLQIFGKTELLVDADHNMRQLVVSNKLLILPVRQLSRCYQQSLRRPKLLQVRVRACESQDISDVDDAQSAITAGLKSFESKNYGLAKAYFEQAMKLPGSGVKRDRYKPQELSDGEKQAVYYNLACCYTQEAEYTEAIQMLAKCFEAGYRNFDQVMKDEDLKLLQENEPRFKSLLDYFGASRLKQNKGILSWLK
eukprot:TRINITY_DN5803_c0_g1_i1.p1 TRINITY_DN5803_c0_g1~~TRINITY_DN5803_c0_g1_i1.p1  ORF type:complete len:252 (+),score=10.87 TRINITY_DN5803_c0_g1_i1:127-882(+)